MSKHIEYYVVEMNLIPYSYDNNPALTNPVLYLKGRTNRKFKFTTQEEAQSFIASLNKEATKVRRINPLTNPN